MDGGGSARAGRRGTAAVVRPHIPRTGGTAFVVHARAASPDALVSTITTSTAGRVAADVWLLSRLAVAKYRRLRLAVDLLLAALLVLAVALTFA
ncbi:Pycsar system effector family protein [Microbispora sp. H10949]|uniref:Pycsar system effector family protein n=1 Tax=Microbispora sp. H10949 TaxID=2729111 RepID=UPI0037C7E983